MRFFIFFILLIPLAGAVTVAPAVLENSDNTVIVVNMLKEKANYKVTNGKPERFALEPNERMLVKVEHDKSEKTLYIDESTSNNIVTSAAIKIVAKEKKSLLNLFHAKTGLPLRSIIVCALGGILIIAAVFLVRRFL